MPDILAEIFHLLTRRGGERIRSFPWELCVGERWYLYR